MNHKRVQRMMQREGREDEETKGHWEPAYPAENLLKRQFYAEAPLQKLVTDITYLPFGGKMLYFSSILDLCGLQYSGQARHVLVVDTPNQLKTCMLLHSDQGSVYKSQAYRAAVKGKGITMSMP